MGGECKIHGSNEKFTTRFYLEHLSGIENLQCLCVGEKFMCIYIYIYIKAIVVLMCTEFVWFRVGSAADSCGCGNEISGYEQGGKFTFWETICFSRKT